jgi:miniconductance mechanosensitive channel
MRSKILDWLIEQGLSADTAMLVATIGFAVGLGILAIVANMITRRIVVRTVQRVVKRTSIDWDDVFIEQKVLDRLSHIAPAAVINSLAPIILSEYPAVDAFVHTMTTVYMAAIGLSVIDGVINAGLAIYQRFPVSQHVHLKGLAQLLKTILYVIGGIFILSLLLGRSPLVFLSGLGAFTAVLILVFKDAILGLVAGVQISSNDMIRRGDWVEMPKFGADGDVIDVSLTTVKVQNWDKTISSIPTYAFVSDSFRNWRGMTESGGRRIKRSVSLDMNSVRFCDPAMLERFTKIQHIAEYIARKQSEIDEHNSQLGVDPSQLVNGRRMTNLGTFRAYVEAFLRAHPDIHRDMTFLVRHLAPGPEGIAIEIYVFSSDQRWVQYEAIIGDIFDHLLAVIPMFDLRVYQRPSGADLRDLLSARG